MSLVQMFDAAFPPARAYPNCAAVAGYIGGNTPHVWTRGEWLRFSNLKQLPIWTGYQEADPVGHAKDAAAAARALGWRAFHPVTWRAIVLDFENEANEPWIAAFGTQLRAEGFLCWPYLAISALGSDPAGYTVWLPDWTGVPAIPPYPDVIISQYRGNVPWGGTQVDLSVVDTAVLGSFGEGPRV